MNDRQESSSVAAILRSSPLLQGLAILLCSLFGLAIIVNVQMGGEAMWFWYATLWSSGAKLYADLHIPLQPLFVLENAAWMRVFGAKCFAIEMLAVVHLLAFCFCLYLVLRHSEWPNWQKAILLFGAFVICVQDSAYRFDDFHVLADTFIYCSLVLLLMLAKARSMRLQMGLAVALGVLSGLTLTTRLNDGAALLVAAGLCVLFLAERKKFLTFCLFVVVALLIALGVVKLTGDTFSTYISNSVIKAAGSKGGTGSVLVAPFRLFFSSLHRLWNIGKWSFGSIIAMVVASALVDKYWKRTGKYKFLLPLLLPLAFYGISPHLRQQIRDGRLAEVLSVFTIIVTYLLAPVVIGRWLARVSGYSKREWDVREILILLPLAEMASTAASTGGKAFDGFYPQMAMSLLLIPVLQPFRKYASWANFSLVAIMGILAITGVIVKVRDPYSWNNYQMNAMFENRQWIHHPVYGPMYIDRDLLQFSEVVCTDIDKGAGKPDLLSLPYPYPNYFCATPPWHGYVQTWFDISTRSTIEHMMRELDTAPPQWIVYQRQLKILKGQEDLYNHGKPLAQRDLDTMIMLKLATGQWTLVDKKDYLKGDGWYIIRTRP